jgi:hypothetical protein
MTRLAQHLIGLVLLVTVTTATAGSALLHYQAHSEQQCVAWTWTRQASDPSPIVTGLAVSLAEADLDDAAAPATVYLAPTSTPSIRGPPLG